MSTERPPVAAADAFRLEHYVAVAPLAAGGMATAYMGKCVRPGGFSRAVAIQRLHPHLNEDRDFVDIRRGSHGTASRGAGPTWRTHRRVRGRRDTLLAMDSPVTIEHLEPRLLAAVRRTAAPREIPIVFKPALDLVWAFLGKHEGLRNDGHNVFLYHHVERPEAGMPVDFGVEVTRRFEPQGEVRCVETPGGEAAVLVHRGAYGEIPKAHAALHAWCAANGRATGAYSLEVYGDWSNDPSKLETTIQYLLR